ncbi:AIDA repeat-containing protein [Pantoea ananatis]|nr:AIDA repeat-containing protein [Pantoea ananatis]
MRRNPRMQNSQLLLSNSSVTLSVLNGGTAARTTINSGGLLDVSSGGTASSTDLNGIQVVQSGGVALSTNVNSTGVQNVTGTAISSVIAGIQNLYSGATDKLASVLAGGTQIVNSGAAANSALISAGGGQLVSGAANMTSVAGAQSVMSGGQASGSVILNSGFMVVSSGGSASSATINSGGRLNVYDGASATDVVQTSGGALLTSTQALVTGTNRLGSFSVQDGLAKNVLLENDGGLFIEGGDKSENTVINAGREIVAGGTATGTTVNAAGEQIVEGSMLGTQSVTGNAVQTSVNSGGKLTIFDGGVASRATINGGGSMEVNTSGYATDTTINNGGTLSVLNGGIAARTTINSGGLLAVSSGGTASDTTVGAGGLLNIADGGVLTLAGNDFVNNGETTYDTSSSVVINTNISGDGQLTKNGTGTVTLGGTLSQKQINLNAGSLVMDGLQAFTDIIAQAGTSLALTRNTTLTGIIDPTDVDIDSSSTWNITGDSLVDNLTNAGSIVFVPSQGTFTPHTLTVTSLTGNGGTITLNTVAGDSSSPIDKVVIDGGKATGSTGLRVLNRGGLGAQTTGSGIAVIQALNGATTDAGAFSMKQPLVAGAYSYSLYRNADQSWYLTSQKTTPDSSGGTDTVPAGQVNYRDAMWSYAALPSLSMDYDRLVAGTADTRYHYAPDSRIWGRIAAGQLNHPDRGSLAGGSVPESNSAYSFFQLGGDLWQLDGANADWRTGVFGASGLMRSDVWRDGGSASAGTDRDTVYTGGAYLSGHTHGGLRLDGLVQASRHSLKAASNDGTSLSTTGTGWLASAEVGQAFGLTPSLGLEPQLQYTVQGLSMNNGQDEAASLSWSDSRRQSVRAGIKIGTPEDAKAMLAWWVTPSVTQSYGGHSGFSASVSGVAGSQASFSNKLSGTSVGINGGVNARIRKNVTLGVQGGWSESLHGGETGGYYGLVNVGVSFR